MRFAWGLVGCAALRAAGCASIAQNDASVDAGHEASVSVDAACVVYGCAGPRPCAVGAVCPIGDGCNRCGCVARPDGTTAITCTAIGCLCCSPACAAPTKCCNGTCVDPDASTCAW